MKYYVQWASKAHSPAHWVLVLVPAGLLFVLLIPYSLIKPVPRLDALLRLPSVDFGWINLVIGGILVLAGMFFAQWSILWQVTRAKGTPVPVVPTQKLLADGPFKYCRNPMTLGTIAAYLGIAVMVGSLSSIAVVILFGALLVLYLKLVEEKELAMRFGEKYEMYKTKTPFLIPRFHLRQH